MSSRFPTSRLRRSASSRTVEASSRATLAEGGGSSIRPLAAPVIAASGVRRSWETELRSVLRNRSLSAASAQLLGLVGVARPLERRDDLAGERAQQLALVGRERPKRRRQLDRQHAQASTGADERLVERRRTGQRVGLRAGAPFVLEGPVRDRLLARVRREGRERVGQSLEPAGGRRHEHRRGAAEEIGDVTRAGPRHVGRAAQRAQLAAERVERLRPPLALDRELGAVAHARGERAHQDADDQHDGEGDDVLGVGDRERQVRRYEEEIEDARRSRPPRRWMARVRSASPRTRPRAGRPSPGSACRSGRPWPTTRATRPRPRPAAQA